MQAVTAQLHNGLGGSHAYGPMDTTTAAHLFVTDRTDRDTFAATVKNADWTGEKRLWAAVLVAAVEDARCDAVGDHARRERRLARRWFESSDGSAGCFEWVCQVFGFDAGWIRRAVLYGRERAGRGRMCVNYGATRIVGQA